MLNVYHILELPKHGDGFSATSSPAINALDVGSASPPRKVVRLETDVDIASASRARVKSNGVVKMQILGGSANKAKPTDETDKKMIGEFLRVVLHREGRELKETYEKTYNRCRSVVLKYRQGASLYDTLKLELEKCNIRVYQELRQSEKKGMDWIALFVEICDWFHDQLNVVRSVLAFLDQAYVPSVKGLLNIHDLGFALFNARIFTDQAIESVLRESLQLWSSDDERKSERKHPGRHNVAKLLTHLEIHGQYARAEEIYEKITRYYYTHESTNKAEEFAAHPEHFLKHVISRIDSEMDRTRDVFPPMSWSLIQETTEQALMENRAEWLAKEGKKNGRSSTFGEC
ncbi:hypothetical protein V5O48_017371 [Marasmius crinis-equi]|uniref:Cullin N-terminal domain-containing protein n=1 Tax=Marasmius crinis-equi TaxID=585013 RepID=A0ABR3EP60_9AGAR